MKRVFLAALALAAIGVVSVTAAATAGTPKTSVVYDSTAANGAPTNQVSYGPAAYQFSSIGDEVTLGSGARSLSNVTVTLSSWACQQGTWYDKNCVTQNGATFSQPITLSVYHVASDGSRGELIASKTQTLNVPYRPSASSKCGDGRWMTPDKQCKNGLADDVTFSFSGQKLDPTVVYAISYDPAGPAASLNVAVTDNPPSVGSTDDPLWIDGAASPDFDGGGSLGYTPMVQFKASNAS